MFEYVRGFLRDEDGLGTVEIVVLIAVLVGVALIFRNSIIKFVTDIMDSVFSSEDLKDKIKY